MEVMLTEFDDFTTKAVTEAESTALNIDFGVDV